VARRKPYCILSLALRDGAVILVCRHARRQCVPRRKRIHVVSPMRDLALGHVLRKRAVVAQFENAPRGLLTLLDRLLESHP